MGNYELLVPVGAGGMGRVWVARSRGTRGRGRLVAVKTALVNPSADSDYWKVLLDEARIASRVRHPNVCAIHSASRERGVVYLVMDWSDGGTLHDLLAATEGRRLDPLTAVRIATRLCAGLEVVHELRDDDGEPLNVVHRDVSPQNILLSTNGQIRLTDFGVAKARGQLHDPTQTGEVKGKISYMAPEQVTQRDFDRRVDVFATGCVLYEATTASRPFGGEDALSTLYQLLETPVTPPRERVAGYPDELNAIVCKALARDPDQRFQTAEEMARALEQFLTSRRAVIGDAEIGALTRSTLAESISSRERQIDAAVAKLDDQVGSTAPPSAVAVRPHVSTPSARRSTPVAVRIAAGSLAALFVATLVFAASNRGVQAPPVSLSASAEVIGQHLTRRTDTDPMESSPAKVEITLSASPPQARWHIDDGPALPNPHRLVVTPDANIHRIRAVAEGYDGFTHSTTFERTTELHAELIRTVQARPTSPQPTTTTSPKPKPKPLEPNVGKPAPLAPATPNAPSTRSIPEPVARPLPVPSSKPVRELDRDNPYVEDRLQP